MAELQTLNLILFAAGTFTAALVTGVAGFAFGIVAAAVWLHFLSPAQTTTLIVAYGLIVQGVSVWKLRRSIKLERDPIKSKRIFVAPAGSRGPGPPSPALGSRFRGNDNFIRLDRPLVTVAVPIVSVEDLRVRFVTSDTTVH